MLLERNIHEQGNTDNIYMYGDMYCPLFMDTSNPCLGMMRKTGKAYSNVCLIHNILIHVPHMLDTQYTNSCHTSA